MASRAELTAIIEEAAARHGVPASALLSIAQIESRMNAGANNPTSSAAGLFQFVDATAREYGLTGDKRNDAAAQADAAARMMATNSRSLTRALGREPDAGELYLAHQQGLGGATALLRNPGKTALEVLTGVYGSEAKARKALTGNGGKASMTASEFAGQWVSKGNSTAARIPPASVGSGNAVATALDTARPAPMPAKPSAAIIAARNPSPQRINYGQGPEGVGIMPAMKGVERFAAGSSYRVADYGVQPKTATNAGDDLAMNPVRGVTLPPVTARTGANGNILVDPPAPARPGQSTIERSPAPKVVEPVSGVTRVAGLAGQVALPPGVRPNIKIPEAPAAKPVNIDTVGKMPLFGDVAMLGRGAGPNAPVKADDRLTTVAQTVNPVQPKPPTKEQVEAGTGFRLGTGKSALTTTEVEVANPAYARLLERVKQGEMSLSGLSRDAVDQRAKGLAAVAKLKEQLAGMKQTTTVTRQTRAPVAAPVAKPAAKPAVAGRQTSAVQAFRDQGYSPSQAYDAANRASVERAIANSANPEQARRLNERLGNL